VTVTLPLSLSLTLSACLRLQLGRNQGVGEGGVDGRSTACATCTWSTHRFTVLAGRASAIFRLGAHTHTHTFSIAHRVYASIATNISSFLRKTRALPWSVHVVWRNRRIITNKPILVYNYTYIYIYIYILRDRLSVYSNTNSII